ncbi:hypothetical protein LJC39_03300 [Parabacteroides sp. OttesenSCG-928-B22]|nr:hypothetical protein [Parabacteroides sp. OttesenSCG-928-B22]
MAMTVKRRKDTSVKKVFQHRVADIRGGVGVKTSDLGGDYLFEGTPLGAAENGLCGVVKYAKVVTAVTATATTIEVEKGSHFKVGDFVSSDEKAKAYAITAIDKTNTAKDIITIGTTLGVAIAVGGFIVEAKAEASGNTSELKVTPQSLNGTGYQVNPKDNIFTDAWLIGVTRGNELPACIADKLKGIINI